MLAAQRELQETSMGYAFGQMTTTERVAYVKDMVLALSNELQAEVLGEVSWKSWTSGDPFINVAAYKKELIDCVHFLMNLMLAVDMTADELYDGYLAKRAVNQRRQVEGYDGVSTKCPGCKRALDDSMINEVLGYDDTIQYLCDCGTEVPRALVPQLKSD